MLMKVNSMFWCLSLFHTTGVTAWGAASLQVLKLLFKSIPWLLVIGAGFRAEGKNGRNGYRYQRRKEKGKSKQNMKEEVKKAVMLR